jgi:hypothetical protein
MKKKSLLVLVAMALLILPGAVNATTVSIQPPSIYQVDQVIFSFDVFLDDIGTLADLDYWNLRLGITPMAGATFDSALDVRSDASYVFLGDADDYLVDVAPHMITIANNTASGAGAAVAGGELLATIFVDATGAAPGIYDVNSMDLGVWSFFGDSVGGFDDAVALAAPYQFEVVPIPAAVWLLGAGLLGLVGLRRKSS